MEIQDLETPAWMTCPMSLMVILPFHLILRKATVNFFKSFFYRTVQLWNSLPLEIRKIGTLVKFKLEVKDLLWNKLLSNNFLERG